jgi:LPXTG-motif cell wall-anchored protein
MLAMVLAAAVPALAQSVTQVGEGNIACVQTAVQQNIVSQGASGNAQATGEGDNVVANVNVNAQTIAQECNISVNEADTAIKYLPVKKYASASATATATAAPVVQYKKYSPAPAVQYEYSASPTASASATASASSAPAAELPSTGGSSLIALGAGVLLVAGGLLARRIVR